MIQRVQTLYLLLATCAFAFCLWVPIAKYAAPLEATQQTVLSEFRLIPKEIASDGLDLEHAEEVFNDPIPGYLETWPLIILVVACVAIAAISVGLYKNRIRQMRVVAFGFLLGVIYCGLIFFWAIERFGENLSIFYQAGPASSSYTIGTWTPVVGVVLMFLAQRAIRKDEEKVRAADRLR